MRQPIQIYGASVPASGVRPSAGGLNSGNVFSGSCHMPFVASFVRRLARERVLREARRPRLIEPLLERAALIRPVRVVIARRHDGADAGEVRRWAMAASICVAPT